MKSEDLKKYEEALFRNTKPLYSPNKKVINWKYSEDKLLKDLEEYLAKTYSQHYKNEDSNIECFDAWIALGDSGPTFRNTALKYLWRYGKKNGKNKDDLMKALHYIILLLHVDHYKGDLNERTEE